MAPAIAATASNLFRMLQLLRRWTRTGSPARNPPNSPRRTSFPENHLSRRCNFRHFSQAREPIEATGVSYRWSMQEDKMFPDSIFPEAP
jgi:hypothetical protein